MSKQSKIEPIVRRYFNLIIKNLPHNCQLKWHTDINDQDTKITIYHTHGSFGVDKSELIRLWREQQINQIFGANTYNTNLNTNHEKGATAI